MCFIDKRNIPLWCDGTEFDNMLVSWGGLMSNLARVSTLAVCHPTY